MSGTMGGTSKIRHIIKEGEGLGVFLSFEGVSKMNKNRPLCVLQL